MYFPNYRLKIFLRPLSKKRRFKTHFHTQHVKASQILVKSPWERFYYVLSSFSEKLISKLSPLVLGQILRVFVNTLSADDKYPFQNCENLPLPIQTKLSGKRKAFSEFFVPFLDFTSSFKHFKRKYYGHS